MADDITRKEFLQAGVATIVATTLGACASDDGDDEDGADSGDDDGGDCTSPSANIATNHTMPHDMNISAGDVSAGAAKDYDIAGSAGHSHTVSLSADDMATLAAGDNVTVTSTSTDAHTHMVTVSC